MKKIVFPMALAALALLSFGSCREKIDTDNNLVITKGVDIQGTSATLSGAIGADFDMSVDYTPGFYFGDKAGLSESNSEFISAGAVGTDGSFSGKKTGLNYGKTYYYNAVVKQAGKVLLGKERSMTVGDLAVTGITLDKTTLSLKPGTTAQLTATIKPEGATNQNISWKSDNTTVATVSGTGLVTAKKAGSAKITVTTEDGGKTATCTVYARNECPAGAVDLGLSVYWATCNVGASTPQATGNLYAWGETSTKGSYSWSNYSLCDGSKNSINKYNTMSSYGKVDGKTTLDPADDAAAVALKGTWRMPDKNECQELIEGCNWIWTTVNGVSGYKVVAKKDSSKYIFLPMAASSNSGINGYFWIREGNGMYGSVLRIYQDYYRVITLERFYGIPIRPVSD